MNQQLFWILGGSVLDALEIVSHGYSTLWHPFSLGRWWFLFSTTLSPTQQCVLIMHLHIFSFCNLSKTHSLKCLSACASQYPSWYFFDQLFKSLLFPCCPPFWPKCCKSTYNFLGHYQLKYWNPIRCSPNPDLKFSISCRLCFNVLMSCK